MPQIHGFTVSIGVEDKDLDEFNVEQRMNDDGRSSITNCWVASEAGKEFRINITPPLQPRYSHWVFTPCLDGVPIRGSKAYLFRTDAQALVTISGAWISSNSTKPFRFATIQLTDDDSALEASKKSRIGQITIQASTFQDYVVLESDAASVVQDQTKNLEGPVHEKAKKCFVNRVNLGEPTVLPEEPTPTVWTMTPLDVKHEAVVVFNYRTLDVLVAEGVAPRSALPAASATSVASGSSSRSSRTLSSEPQAGPSSLRHPVTPNSTPLSRRCLKREAEDEAEEGDSEEERQLEARLAALRAQKSRSSPNKRVRFDGVIKTEPLERHFLRGEVIDLTQD